jgi:dolichol-phosphate mannosyltransferase
MMLSIVVPTYNERDNLPVLVERLAETLAGVSFEVVVVDDDSPDKTWEVAQALSQRFPFVRIIRRTDDRDLSTAVLAGFAASAGDVLAVMDADLQHPPEMVADMLQRLENGADLAVGSRYCPGGSVGDWGVLRRFVSWGATLLGTICVPQSRKTTDPLSGFFMLRRDVIADAHLKPTGYKILMEILAKGSFMSVADVPITFGIRQSGKSSLGIRVLLRYVRHVFRLCWECGELFRMARFGLVGLSGVAVNLGLLWALTDCAGLYYLVSAAVAIEASIVSNFVLNDRWTFSDCRKHGSDRWPRRLATFNIISLPSFPMQLGVMGVLKEFFGMYYLAAAVVGILVVFVWNFVANSLWTWRHR